MKTKMMISVLLLVLLTLVAFSASAFDHRPKRGCGPGAQCGFEGGMPGPGGAHKLELLTVALDLTPDQQQKISQLIRQQRATMQDKREQRQLNHLLMWQLIDADVFDEAAFREQAEKVAAERIDMMVARAKIKYQVLAVLTPPQQEKAKKLWQLMGPANKGRGGAKKALAQD